MTQGNNSSDNGSPFEEPFKHIVYEFQQIEGGHRLVDLLFSCLNSESRNMDIHCFLKKLKVAENRLLYQLTQFLYPDRLCDTKHFEEYYDYIFSLLYDNGLKPYIPLSHNGIYKKYDIFIEVFSIYLMSKGYVAAPPTKLRKEGGIYLSMDEDTKLFSKIIHATDVDDHTVIHDNKYRVNLFFILDNFPCDCT